MEGRKDRIIILGCMCRPWRGDPSMLRGEGIGAARNADRCRGQRDCSGVGLEHHCKAGYWLLLKQPKQVVECDAEDEHHGSVVKSVHCPLTPLTRRINGFLPLACVVLSVWSS